VSYEKTTKTGKQGCMVDSVRKGERNYTPPGKLPEVSGNIKEVLEFKFGQDFKRKDKV